MGIPNILNTGKSGLLASKLAIATTGHNITNASTEGYSRQRVQTTTAPPQGGGFGHNVVGTGTQVLRVERINDEYIDKQIRTSQRDLSHFEEKDLSLRQIENVFNEMDGDGLNRLVSKFFNEFRILSDEPESDAVRQAVREASQSMVNDFHRLRSEVVDIGGHIDARIEGYTAEVNTLVTEITNLNEKIRIIEPTGGSPNDLLDKRDLALKKLSTFLDTTSHYDKQRNVCVDLRGGGPLISGSSHDVLTLDRTPADEDGKLDGSYDVQSGGKISGPLTHHIKGGKLGALIEVRDKTVTTILNRLDDMAFAITESVNGIHMQGVTLEGLTNIAYFKPLLSKSNAAELMSLSTEVKNNINNITTGLLPNSPGDNRIAIGISQIQNKKIMNEGHSTIDEFYNSIVSDVGVATAKNKFSMNQEKDIVTQLNKIRDQISGVSIDEETTDLLQFQHAFDASAKIIQIADDLLKTVLSLKRD